MLFFQITATQVVQEKLKRLEKRKEEDLENMLLYQGLARAEISMKQIEEFLEYQSIPSMKRRRRILLRQLIN